MYTMLAATMFGIIAVLAISTPILSMSRRKAYIYFCWFWFLLYLAQLFMYTPGADVSPYRYATGTIESASIRFFGLTVSAFASIAFFLYMFFSIFWKKRKFSKTEFSILLCTTFPNLILFMRSSSISENIDVFIKTIMMFLVYFEMQQSMNQNNAGYFRMLVETINVILLVQIGVSKLLTGSTSAYNYYYELAEEYFGYYNHPHSFTSLLWVISLFNVYQVARKRHIKLNVMLLLINVFVILKTGVRTYLLALAVGLLYIGIRSMWDKNGASLRKYVLLAMVAMLFLSGWLLDRVGAGRTYITEDVSSGRFARWGADLLYYWADYSLIEKLFGRGMNAVYQVNKILFGTYINSLNLLIDLLLDYGIVGTIMLVYAYYKVFTLDRNKKNSLFIKGIFVSLISAAMVNSPFAYVPTMSMLVVIIFIIQNEKLGFNGFSSVKEA